MKLTSISDDFFELCKFDKELLDNEDRRPYLLILNLDYKGNKYKFALPFRSNISAKTPKSHYFKLPPASTTRNGNSHGLMYKKIFPITNKYLEYYAVDKNPYYTMLLKFIEKNKNEIISNTQKYLKDYEDGNMPQYCTGIDKIFSALGINHI